MLTDRYAKIREALELGPTPGPWFHGAANGAHMYCVYDKRCWTDEDGARHGETPNMIVNVSPDDGKYANAAYIAACDPDTIRGLLAERDALAAENERLRDRLAEALKALDGLLEPFEGDDCRYDHHGYCQEHFLQEGDECCVKIARRVREGGKVE